MKTALITVLFLMAANVPLWAAVGTDVVTDRQGGNIEQKKAKMQQRIDEKIANNQAEKACIQSAKTDSELQACKGKFHDKKNNQNNSRQDKNQ